MVIFLHLLVIISLIGMYTSIGDGYFWVFFIFFLFYLRKLYKSDINSNP